MFQMYLSDDPLAIRLRIAWLQRFRSRVILTLLRAPRSVYSGR